MRLVAAADSADRLEADGVAQWGVGVDPQARVEAVEVVQRFVASVEGQLTQLGLEALL